MLCHAMHPIQDLFLGGFSYVLQICILHALLRGQNIILVKSGCYRLHLVSCPRSGRPGGALPREMTSQTTLERSSTSTASLSWCTVRGWGIRAGALLHALARWLQPIGFRWLLLRPLHLEARMLGLKIRSLRRKLRVWHLYWHRRPVHLEWLEKTG
jgi:hypothetical protein